MSQLARFHDNSKTGLSPGVWSRHPQDMFDYPLRANVVWWNFGVNVDSEFAAGAEAVAENYGSNIKHFADTGGLGTNISDEIGGSMQLSSDGDDEGASFASVGQAFKISSPEANFWFEARVKKSTLTDTKHGIFVGMSEDLTLSATVPIAADGTLADQNLVGFHNLEADGDKFDTVYKANGVTAVTVKADAITIVADTYVKLGMTMFNQILTFYKDGVALADTKTVPDNTGTDFPADVIMGPIMAVLNATGSTPGSAQVDWVACAQLRS